MADIAGLLRRSVHGRPVAALWPFAVLALTPLIVLGGLVAVIGVVGLTTVHHVHAWAPKPKRSQLAAVVTLDSSPVDVTLRHAA